MIDQEIQARMNAFRGNPQALMQRYAQSQQLLDLLALQKLKSEKEAAARQMQMQAGQGQMPTVAQQREQELLGMAKQDVAQRVGQVAQQQAKQQQENLQRAAQTGIAQAPAPNMMPTQAMASGGIVAFSGGGETAFTRGVKSLFGIEPPTEEETASRKRREELAAIQSEFDVGPFQGAFTLSAEDYDRRAAVRDYIQKNRRELLDNPQLFAAFKANPEAFVSGGMRTAVGRIASAAPAGGVPPVTAGDERFEGRSVPVPKTPRLAGGVPPEAAPPPAVQLQGGRPAPTTVPGTGDISSSGLRATPGGMPASAPQDQGIAQAAAAPAGAQPTGLRQLYEKAIGSALGTDLGAVSADAEAAYAKRFDPLFQQQLALKQQGLAEAQRLAERERAMRDPLMAWMAGARGRTIGEVLGNAGRAGMEYQQQGLTRDQALAKQLQDLREAQLGAQITQEKEKYGVGEARRKELLGEREKAMTSVGSYLSRTEVDAVRSQLNEARMTLMQQGLDDRRIAAATTAANHTLDNLQRRLKAVQDAKAKPATAVNAAELEKANAEEAQIRRELEEVLPNMLRLFKVPVAEKSFTAPAPVTPAIPPMPAGAVRPKGAK